MAAALRALLLALPLSVMLAGIVDLVAVSLGGSSAAGTMALGGVLLALGWGAVHEGAGRPPARASFAWLGLAAALPLISAWAPWSGLGALVLVLPLRATGARITGLVSERGAALTGAACGAILGIWWVLGNGLGLPAYLAVWALTGIAQRYLLPPPNTKVTNDPVPPGTALFGAGTAFLLLTLRPWLDVLDSSSAVNDVLRFTTIGVVFLLGWVTLGGAFAVSRHHRIYSLLAAVVLGALATGAASDAAWYSSRPGYTASIGSAALRRWTESDAPYLSEENPVYPIVLAAAMLALPIVLAGIMARSLGGPRPRGRAFVSPLLAGSGCALVLAGLAPDLFLRIGGAVAAAALLGGAALEGWWTPGNRARRMVLTGLPLVAVALFVRPSAPPQSDYPFPDAYRWSIAERETEDGMERLEQVTATSVVRVLQRESAFGNVEEFLFSGRNLAAPESSQRGAWLAEAHFLIGLVGAPQRTLLIGTPWSPGLDVFRAAGAEEITLACDPPELAHMELRRVGGADDVNVVRTVSRSSGEYDLILLREALLWDGRHHLMRTDWLAQCDRRLRPGGVIAFACSPAQLEEDMLIPWIDEFRRRFEVVELWILPAGLDDARLIVTGREFRSAIADGDVLRADLKDLSAVRPFLYRAPLQASLPKLSATDRKAIDAHRSVQRAARVMAELRDEESGEARSLLRFYALQLAAQQYSIHDSYLVDDAYAVEIGAEALSELLRVTRASPDSATLTTVWANVGRGLVEQQEIGAAEQYFGILHDELGWRHPEVMLTLAHAAIEMLEEELALERLDVALEGRPDWKPALELQRIIRAGEAPQRDLHAGHDHD